MYKIFNLNTEHRMWYVSNMHITQLLQNTMRDPSISLHTCQNNYTFYCLMFYTSFLTVNLVTSKRIIISFYLIMINELIRIRGNKHAWLHKYNM